jgi:hypothetical protein
MYELQLIRPSSGGGAREIVAEFATIAECIALWEQWQGKEPSDEQYVITEDGSDAVLIHIQPNGEIGG